MPTVPVRASCVSAAQRAGPPAPAQPRDEGRAFFWRAPGFPAVRWFAARRLRPSAERWSIAVVLAPLPASAPHPAPLLRSRPLTRPDRQLGYTSTSRPTRSLEPRTTDVFCSILVASETFGTKYKWLKLQRFRIRTFRICRVLHFHFGAPESRAIRSYEFLFSLEFIQSAHPRIPPRFARQRLGIDIHRL